MKTSSIAIIAAVMLGSLSAQPGRAQDMDSSAPVVVKTVPEAGAKDVPPGEYEVRVTFSKEMRDRSWSWSTAWEDSTPEMIGKPHYDADRKTCVLKVKLEPGKTYGWWLNSEKFTNFKDAQGHPAVPYLLTFQCAESAGAAVVAAGLHINPATGMQEGGQDDMSSANVMTMGYKTDGEVKDLIASGKYDAALQRCLDFHDKYKSANGSLIPLLGDWVELGRRYPKAKEALIDIRDKDVREFAEGRGYFDLFSEVNSINGYLHQEDSTYALYKSLGNKDPELERQCYLYVEGLLVAKGEYQTYYDHMNGDAQGKFDSINESYTRQLENQKRMAEQNQRTAKMLAEINKKNGMTNLWSPADTSGMLKKNAENSFVGGVRQLVEVLVGTGHKEEAVKICNEAITVLDDERLHSAVTEAELKVKRRTEAEK